MDRLERLVNLVALLADTDHPLGLEEIVGSVPGYAGSTEEAVRRSFERDKKALREMGIDVRAESRDALGTQGARPGYRIPKDATIPDPGLTVAERSAVAVASGLVWGEDGDEDSGGGLVDPLVATLLVAVTGRRSMSFEYGGLSGPGEVRRVEPRTLVFRAGTWYIVGRDLDAADERSFRVDRIVGGVSVGGAGGFARPESRSGQPVPRRPWEVGRRDPVEVVVAVRPERLWWVERETQGTRVDSVSLDGTEWPCLAVAVRDMTAFVVWVQGLGGDGVVTSPDSAVAEMRAELTHTRQVVA
ncbi:MAG: WYL domain-containing protein [Acidimicrobiia bacterium]|nr:WYL domain-containing protein [Acidimicrobiia bacterium]